MSRHNNGNFREIHPTRARWTSLAQWKRRARYSYLRFLRLRGTPEQIARGFAVGVFWGMFPLPGVQMVIAVITAAVLRGSKVAAAAGTWLTNPVTTLPFTALNFHIGQALLGQQWRDLPNVESVNSLLSLGRDVLIAYLLGCLVTGTVGGLVSYGVGVPIATWVKQHRRKKK